MKTTPCINRNATPDNNWLITYYIRVSNLQKIHTIPCTISLHILETRLNAKTVQMIA